MKWLDWFCSSSPLPHPSPPPPPLPPIPPPLLPDLIIFFLLILETGSRRDRQREQDWSVHSWKHSHLESNPQPTYIPWPGIDLATLRCMVSCSNQLSHPDLLNFIDSPYLVHMSLRLHICHLKLIICLIEMSLTAIISVIKSLYCKYFHIIFFLLCLWLVYILSIFMINV